MKRDVHAVPRSVGPAQVRGAALALVDEYARTDGVSPSDDYDAVPRVHPMAEAKYLMACRELAGAGAIDPATVRDRVGASVGRLRATDVGRVTGTSAWGLGFSFRDLPPDEPFTITTALVVEALARVRPIITGEVARDCDVLVAAGLRWLTEVLPRVTEDRVALPAYSPGLPVVANNVAAYWSGVVASLVPDPDPRRTEARTVAASVLGRHVDGVGWTYGTTSPRVDLVHTCYVGHGLLTALPDRVADVGERVMTAVLQFGGREWSDRFDRYDLAEGLGVDRVRPDAVARVAGDSLLVGFDVPARSWSMGEAMVLFGELAGTARGGGLHRSHAQGLAARVLRERLPECRYRHGMHLAHGLAVAARLTGRP